MVQRIRCPRSLLPVLRRTRLRHAQMRFLRKKIYLEGDSPHPPTIAEYGDYTAAQTDDSILIFKGDRLVYHASYTGDPMTEDELKDHIAFVFGLGMTDD